VTLFRCLTVFWIFCGFLIISQGFAMLPFVAERRDIRFLALIVGLATVATASRPSAPRAEGSA
jgi:hypothetical protein